MPSTWSTSLRLNYQAPGDNLNAWGVVLNQQVFQRLEDAVAKRVAFSLSGAKALTTANGLEDEARCAFLDITGGTGGVVTAPAVEKWYIVRNGASGDVSLTTGAGATATIYPGEVGTVVCDASNIRRVQLLRSPAAPAHADDIVNKAYADALAFNEVDLPGQGPGTVGAVLFSNGVSARWGVPTFADIGGAAPIDAPEFTSGVTVNGSAKSTPIALSGTEIDVSGGDFFTASISSDTTFAITGAAAEKASAFLLKLTINGAAAPSFPANVEFSGGVQPTLVDGTHILGFITFDGGVSWLMVLIGYAIS